MEYLSEEFSGEQLISKKKKKKEFFHMDIWTILRSLLKKMGDNHNL